jgi:hypothetical protein
LQNDTFTSLSIGTRMVQTKENLFGDFIHFLSNFILSI